jgi:hypothetical protein
MIEKGIMVGNQGYPMQYPDECPICHHYSEIQLVRADEVLNHTMVQVVYQCAFTACKSYFIGYYGPKPQKELKSLKPIMSDASIFSDTISKLSPTFMSIFLEAEQAAQLGLAQIAGPGYRKAFEFLIKDYAKSLAPDKSEQIERTFSGKVVTDFITDPRIHNVAKRTLWLGNDESHYLRKWTSHDIDDLITLVKLTVNWIEIDQLSRHYSESMPE